jgi:sn-glycerol 3-phosphate transport system permease protein
VKRTVFRNRWLPYLLVLPQVAVTLVFFFWPAFGSLRLSLYRSTPFGDRLIFAGADNFVRLLRSDEYLQSVVHSFVFAAGVTGGGLAISLGLAVLANQRIRGLALYRTALLWPYGIAPAVAGIIWLFVFHPAYGVLPFALRAVTAIDFNWLLKGWVAMLMLVTAAIWKQLGYNIAFFLAGLQAIPGSVLEAAQVDGAGPVRRFWAVVFPLLSPITFFLVVLNMVFAFFETFGLVHAVTQGGPGHATEILVYKAYNDGFVNQQLGTAAAQSVLLMVVVIGLTMLQFRYAEKKVVY